MTEELTPHHLLWSDFDALARGQGGPDLVRRLRAAERSRRLLLLRSIIDQTTKSADLSGPLPSPESAWELLARVQEAAPDALEAILAHPYTGSWAGYTTRLCDQDVSGVCPFWVHMGHVHCLAAAAAVRAGLTFEIEVPVWQGNVPLPTLGMAHLRAEAPFSVALVHGRGSEVTVVNQNSRIDVPAIRSADTSGWSGIREAVSWSGGHELNLRLDDLDPYRGLYEPIPPQRLGPVEVESWRTVLDRAWALVVEHLPEIADTLSETLDSLVPEPAVPFRLPSASTGEAFGSAIIAYADQPAPMAAALVHEFQHIRLGGLLHLVRLTIDDPRERLYAPWRDDPRPIAGVLHGIYAFFGVTSFWRALATAEPGHALAAFEFAHWRAQVRRTLVSVRGDASLTPAGHRFLEGVAERLEPWQHETVAAEPGALAKAAAGDHYAAWRLRHLRPGPGIVAALATAWRSGRSRPELGPLPEPPAPTPIPDGSWTNARTDLIRLRITNGDAGLATHGPWVPGATEADLHLTAGRPAEATAGYRRLLATEPDDPSALIGLGLALATSSANPASRAILHRPELVRAVHRTLRSDHSATPSIEAVAGWIGRFTH